MLELTKEQWAEWRSHPATEYFFDAVKQRREEEIAKLAYGVYQDNKKQDLALGMVGAFTHIMNATYEEGV